MKTQDLSGIEPTPAQICLGCNRMGAEISAADAFVLMDAYVEAGGNFLDTASVYSDWIPGVPKSVSEKTIGAWMRARGNRQAMVIATKGGHPDLQTMHISRLSPAEILHDLEASLRNLQTEVIDLYWLHRDDPARPVAEMIDTLDAQVRAGKIRTFGCSNWQPARMQAALDYASLNGLHGFVANQPMWSLAIPNPAAFGMPGLAAMDAETFDFHRRTGLAAIPYSSQARGFFSKLAEHGLEGLAEKERQAYVNPQNLERFRRCQVLARDHGATTAQVVLAYLLAQPVPTFPVIGSRTLDQLAETLASANVSLSLEEVAYLDGKEREARVS